MATQAPTNFGQYLTALLLCLCVVPALSLISGGAGLDAEYLSPHRVYSDASSEAALCSACEEIVAVLEAFVTSSSTEESLEQWIGSYVCSAIPDDTLVESGLAILCQAAIDIGVNHLADMLLEKESPTTVCAAMSLCPAIPVPPFEAEDESLDLEDSDAVCVVCEYVINFLEEFISADATKEEIEDFLDQVCTYMPGFLEGVCDFFFAKGVDKLMDLILSDHPPDLMCAQLGACHPVFTPMPLDNSPAECALCKDVIGPLEDWLDSGKTVEEILGLVDDLCSILPDKEAVYCDAMVADKLPALIDALVTDYPADVVCELVSMCA
ncbi:hypothetical protein KIPB_008879 [Kipferlia bialata]|uniref:Saposin B-type domain-containing protein n=1 Tax=Kipferlia bialata TaxID=797122 RepID=A0A9K3GL58_9EUKA|nr:hypothetical protein KIPB_008879 [Kipferlia bialata]|eukprot:g8879.t1